MMRRALLALYALLIALSARPLRAASPDPKRAEAAERFERAIRLVNAGDLSGGLAEFQRTYALEPSVVVLYNVGLVYGELQRPVDAVRALERALKDPGALEPAELERARAALRQQAERIGRVELLANVQAGVVEIDNIEAAALPLTGPLEVAVGAHTVALISPGFAPLRRELVIAGGQTVQASFELVPIQASLAHLAVDCTVPAADVVVDGQRVGKTPLVATVTVTPGSHKVEVLRAGYRPSAQSIELQEGATGRLTMTPVLDPSALNDQGTLSIQASETQAVVSVDGESPRLLSESLRIPYGAHRIRLERGGFLPAERDVDVPLAKTRTLSVVFEPTPETRANYVASAGRQRTVAGVTTGVGAALAVGGTVFALVQQGKLPAAQQHLAAVNDSFERFSERACDFAMPHVDPAAESNCIAELEAAEANVHDIELARTIGWVTAGAGALVTATGVVLLLTRDDPHKYDEKPNERRLSAYSKLRITPALGPQALFLSATGVF